MLILQGKSKTSGFTIVELLVVIVVIAILAAIALVSYNGITQQAAEASMKSDLRNTATQLAIYNTEEGSYPASLTDDLKTQSNGNVLFYENTGTGYCLSATSSARPSIAFRLTETGAIESGQCPGASVAWLQVSAGITHNLAISTAGKVYGWGYNSYGVLGDGSTTQRTSPVNITNSGALSGKTVTQVSAGGDHSLAVSSDGTAFAWGHNTSGQLGDGTLTTRTSPIVMSGFGALAGKTVTQVSAGLDHSLALTSDGRVYAWGSNDYGQIGDGSYSRRTTPVAVNISGVLAGKTITKVLAGGMNSFALASDGTVYAWGYGEDNGLGDGNSTSSNVPVAVAGSIIGKTITMLATGPYSSSTLALAADGTIHAWGAGPLGDGTYNSQSTAIALTTSGPLSGKNFTQIAASSNISIALASNGAVYTWGRQNYYGQMGDGTTADRISPVAITNSGALSGKTISKVIAGDNHAFALGSDGALYGWGRDEYGLLGDGTTTVQFNSPIALPAPQ